MIKVSVCCPVCRAWFYRSHPAQKYCSPAHRRVGRSIGDNKRRKAVRRSASDGNRSYP